MAENSGFFNAMNVNGAYDRIYNAEDFAAYFANFISSGVFVQPSNQLLVEAKEGLTVNVKAGKAYINGYWYTLTEDKELVFSPNMTGSTIQCKVVCEHDISERVTTVHTKENVTSLLPDSKNELVLATFSLPVGVSEITQAMLADRRPDRVYCGFVTGLVDQIDINTLLKQDKAQFEEWFEDMKGQLSEDAAGSLQNQLDTLKETYYKSGYSARSGLVKAEKYDFNTHVFKVLSNTPDSRYSGDGFYPVKELPYGFVYGGENSPVVTGSSAIYTSPTGVPSASFRKNETGAEKFMSESYKSVSIEGIFNSEVQKWVVTDRSDFRSLEPLYPRNSSSTNDRHFDVTRGTKDVEIMDYTGNSPFTYFVLRIKSGNTVAGVATHIFSKPQILIDMGLYKKEVVVGTVESEHYWIPIHAVIGSSHYTVYKEVYFKVSTESGSYPYVGYRNGKICFGQDNGLPSGAKVEADIYIVAPGSMTYMPRIYGYLYEEEQEYFVDM